MSDQAPMKIFSLSEVTAQGPLAAMAPRTAPPGMKKVLIIKTSFDFMPLGIGYVLSALERHGIPFDFWDMLRPNRSEAYYLEEIRRTNYLAIGTGGYVFNIHDFISLTRKCREQSPGTPIVLGGNITRNMKPPELFKYIDVDYIYIGEVEASFAEFLFALHEGVRDFSEISGIAFKHPVTGEITKSGQRRVDLGMEAHMPAYHHLDVPHYIGTNKHIRFSHAGRAMAMLTGRGCTGGCTFCSPTVGKFMAPALQKMFDEMVYLKDHYEFELFNFITEIFFEHPHEVIEFCDAYKAMDIGKPWFCCLSPHMPTDIYPAMKEAGCIGFNMGLESGSDRILSKTKFNCTVEGFERRYKAAQENGLFIDVSYMVGNENETQEDMRATFDTLMRNRMQQESFNLVCAYPGTSIYAKAKHRGKVPDELAYIKAVMSGRYWRTYNIGEFDYMNISAIPDAQVLETVIHETRRYYTHLFRTFQAQDQQIALAQTPAGGDAPAGRTLELTGTCIDCGNALRREADASWREGIAELTVICNRCFTRNFFDVMAQPGYAEHFAAVRERLEKAERAVILGRGKLTEELFLYDIFGLDLRKVSAVIDERTTKEELEGIEEQSYAEVRKFYHLPRLRRRDVSKVDFDTAVVGNLIPEIVNGFYPPDASERLVFLAPTHPRPRRSTSWVRFSPARAIPTARSPRSPRS